MSPIQFLENGQLIAKTATGRSQVTLPNEVKAFYSGDNLGGAINIYSGKDVIAKLKLPNKGDQQTIQVPGGSIDWFGQEATQIKELTLVRI